MFNSFTLAMFSSVHWDLTGPGGILVATVPVFLNLSITFEKAHLLGMYLGVILNSFLYALLTLITF